MTNYGVVNDESSPELTVIVVSYNTRDLTISALKTLQDNTKRTSFRTVVFDNASVDGSAEEIAREFPGIEVISSRENVGFARANNIAANTSETEWILLLNPDTECYPDAVDNLLDFSKSHPEAGITGGRTFFPNGELNIASCWMRITPWSVFCKAIGISTLFPRSRILNPEAIGGWQRDSEREVDIVVGCFLMIRSSIWKELGGFNLKYFMYGEEADLCLRARSLGYRPMITPDASIMHIVGAASRREVNKLELVNRARITILEDHWPSWLVPYGRCMTVFGVGLRATLLSMISILFKGYRKEARKWSELWLRRKNWSRGY